MVATTAIGAIRSVGAAEPIAFGPLSWQPPFEAYVADVSEQSIGGGATGGIGGEGGGGDGGGAGEARRWGRWRW